jgi:ankyrin repeat protein
MSWLPIHVAACDGALDRVLAFLQGDAALLHAETASGWDPLTCAASKGQADVCSLLLTSGAQVDHRTRNGETALFWPCLAGHVRTVALLLEAGADARIAGAHKNTPLMAAASQGHWEVVRLLLQHGDSDVDARDLVGGRTALWKAAEWGHAQAVRLLLGAGADASIANAEGLTPLAVAARHKHRACAALLEVRALELGGAGGARCVEGSCRCPSLCGCSICVAVAYCTLCLALMS